jgi:hypothetical protein
MVFLFFGKNFLQVIRLELYFGAHLFLASIFKRHLFNARYYASVDNAYLAIDL